MGAKYLSFKPYRAISKTDHSAFRGCPKATDKRSTSLKCQTQASHLDRPESMRDKYRMGDVMMQWLTMAQGQPSGVKWALSALVIVAAAAALLFLWRTPALPASEVPKDSAMGGGASNIHFGGNNSGVVIGTYNAAPAANATSASQSPRQSHTKANPDQASQAVLREKIEAELRAKRALVAEIVDDWTSSNDGIPSTQAGILDKATPYINEQLRIRGKKWIFNREMRKILNFPPAIGDSYSEN